MVFAVCAEGHRARRGGAVEQGTVQIHRPRPAAADYAGFRQAPPEPLVGGSGPTDAGMQPFVWVTAGARTCRAAAGVQGPWCRRAWGRPAPRTSGCLSAGVAKSPALSPGRGHAWHPAVQRCAPGTHSTARHGAAQRGLVSMVRPLYELPRTTPQDTGRRDRRMLYCNHSPGGHGGTQCRCVRVEVWKRQRGVIGWQLQHGCRGGLCATSALWCLRYHWYRNRLWPLGLSCRAWPSWLLLVVLLLLATAVASQHVHWKVAHERGRGERAAPGGQSLHSYRRLRV